MMGLNDLTLFLLADSHECAHRLHEERLKAGERLTKTVKALTTLVGVGILVTLHVLSWVLGSVARNDRVGTFAAVLFMLTIAIGATWAFIVVVNWAEREIRKAIEARRRRKERERGRKEFLAFVQSVRDGLSDVSDEDEAKKNPTTEANAASPSV